MGRTYRVPTPPDPWSVFASRASLVPTYRDMRPPTPWIFRGDPNKPTLVLLAMLATVLLLAALLT